MFVIFDIHIKLSVYLFYLYTSMCNTSLSKFKLGHHRNQLKQRSHRSTWVTEKAHETPPSQRWSRYSNIVGTKTPHSSCLPNFCIFLRSTDKKQRVFLILRHWADMPIRELHLKALIEHFYFLLEVYIMD